MGRAVRVTNERNISDFDTLQSFMRGYISCYDPQKCLYRLTLAIRRYTHDLKEIDPDDQDSLSEIVSFQR